MTNEHGRTGDDSSFSSSQTQDASVEGARSAPPDPEPFLPPDECTTADLLLKIAGHLRDGKWLALGMSKTEWADALEDRAVRLKAQWPAARSAPGGAQDPRALLADWQEQDEALQRIWGALGVDGSPANAGEIAARVEALVERGCACLPGCGPTCECHCHEAGAAPGGAPEPQEPDGRG